MRKHLFIALCILLLPGLALAQKVGWQKPVLGSLPVRHHQLQQGLVFHLLINEGGGFPKDHTDNRNHVTVMADDVDWSTGKHGPSIINDVSNDYMSLPGTNFPSVGNTFTFAAWIYPTVVGYRASIWSPSDTNNMFQLEVGTGTGGGNNKIVVFEPGTWIAQTTSATNIIVVNEWQHIVYTRSGTGAGTHSMYYNGILQVLDRDDAGNFSDGTATRLIGARTATTQEFTGKISEIRIYNKPLTSGEVKWLAQEPFADYVRTSAARHSAFAAAAAPTEKPVPPKLIIISKQNAKGKDRIKWVD